VVIDTSVFLRDALSTSRSGAATQLLAILPAIAHVVMCDEIRDEILTKAEDILGWPRLLTLERYGPILGTAVFVTPVTEREDHRRAVQGDLGDTMFVRVAEAIYVEHPDLVEADQLRFIVSENTRHFRPGSAYAGFLFGTSREILGRLR
jgi:hypothetical protein